MRSVAKKFRDKIDVPSDCWASVRSIIHDSDDVFPEEGESEAVSLLEHWEGLLESLVDEAQGVLDSVRLLLEKERINDD